MLEGISGTAHTLPLLIFHGILHSKVHTHLTGWELFVHIEMALQPGSLCKPSLSFKFKSTIHRSWAQHITQPLWPAPGLLMQWSLASRSLPMQVGCWFWKRCACTPGDAFRPFSQLVLQVVCEEQRALSPIHRQHCALAVHSSRFPEAGFSAHT